MREVLHDGSIRLVLDTCLFSREAVLKAVYWATRDAFISLEPMDSSKCIVATLRSKTSDVPTLENPRPLRAADLADMFENSLIDFQLREDIQSQTSSIREILLTKAFAESGLFEEEPIGTPFDTVSGGKTTEENSGPLRILST